MIYLISKRSASLKPLRVFSLEFYESFFWEKSSLKSGLPSPVLGGCQGDSLTLSVIL